MASGTWRCAGPETIKPRTHQTVRHAFVRFVFLVVIRSDCDPAAMRTGGTKAATLLSRGTIVRPSGLARGALFCERKRRVGLERLLRIKSVFKLVDIWIEHLMDFGRHHGFSLV